MPTTQVLELDESVFITGLFPDGRSNSVLVGLSDGRILQMTHLAANAFLTGRRSAQARFTDGFGNSSAFAVRNLLYRLHRQVARVNVDKELVQTRSARLPASAAGKDRAVAVFTTPVLYAGEDFGRWQELRWREQVPSGGRLQMALRTAASTGATASAPWTYFASRAQDSSESSASDTSDPWETVVHSLDGLAAGTPYLQMRATLETAVAGLSPALWELTVSYRAKFAVYFFSRRFSLQRGAKPDGGLLTAQIVAPTHTEVKFGLSEGNSADWNDYQVIAPDRLFSLGEEFRHHFKVGIKLISYEEDAHAVVDEFALLLGARQKTRLNVETSSSSSFYSLSSSSS
jgi:hypothetical protein